MTSAFSIRAIFPVRAFRPVKALCLGALFISGLMWAGASSAQSIDNYRAENEIRLMEMENQLRRVTGQYEEAMFRLTQVNRRLERSLEDMEFRLGELEQRLAQAGIAPAETPVGDNAVGGDGAGDSPVDEAAASDNAVAPTSDETVPPSSSDAADTMLIDGKPVNILRTPDQAAAAGVVPVPPGAAGANPETSPALFVEGDTPEQQYEAAFAHLRRNELDKAEGAFRGFLVLHPDHQLASNAQYWLGKTYFAQGDYGNATREFLEGYEKYGDGDKAPDTLLHLGLSLGELGQNEDACAAFSELSARYPNADATIAQRATSAEQAVGCS